MPDNPVGSQCLPYGHRSDSDYRQSGCARQARSLSLTSGHTTRLRG